MNQPVDVGQLKNPSLEKSFDQIDLEAHNRQVETYEGGQQA